MEFWHRICIVSCAATSFLFLVAFLRFGQIAKFSEFYSDTQVDTINQRLLFFLQNSWRKTANERPTSMANLLYSITREIDCGTMVRTGKVTDGGKWVCNSWRLKAPCVVYSLGVGGNPSFEAELQSSTGGRCHVYSFDPNPQYARLFKTIPQSTFLQRRIESFTNRTKNITTLGDAALDLGHSKIDILKIDIEKFEYKVMPDVLVSTSVKICQILIEVHGLDPLAWSRLLRSMAEAGFFIFSVEVNMHCLKTIHCVEYSLIHRDCLDEYGIANAPFQSNFGLLKPTHSTVNPRK